MNNRSVSGSSRLRKRPWVMVSSPGEEVRLAQVAPLIIGKIGAKDRLKFSIFIEQIDSHSPRNPPGPGGRYRGEKISDEPSGLRVGVACFHVARRERWSPAELPDLPERSEQDRTPARWSKKTRALRRSPSGFESLLVWTSDDPDSLMLVAVGNGNQLKYTGCYDLSLRADGQPIRRSRLRHDNDPSNHKTVVEYVGPKILWASPEALHGQDGRLPDLQGRIRGRQQVRLRGEARPLRWRHDGGRPSRGKKQPRADQAARASSLVDGHSLRSVPDTSIIFRSMTKWMGSEDHVTEKPSPGAAARAHDQSRGPLVDRLKNNAQVPSGAIPWVTRRCHSRSRRDEDHVPPGSSRATRMHPLPP